MRISTEMVSEQMKNASNWKGSDLDGVEEHWIKTSLALQESIASQMEKKNSEVQIALVKCFFFPKAFQ